MHFGDTSDQANQLRSLMQPSDIERGKYPKWVLDKVKAAVRDGRLPKPETPLLSAAAALEEAKRALGGKWCDHAGRFKWDGIDYLVSEPYAAEIDLQMLTELNRFVEILGTWYVFSANSEHFPSRTVRIVIGPTAGDTTEYRKHEYASAMRTFGRRI